MLSTLVGMLGGQIVDKLFGTFKDIFMKYQDKQITEIEARQLILQALLNSVKEVEVAHAELIAKTFATFMGVVEKNRMVAIVWAMAAVSQLAVLLWHQVGIPFLVYAYREWWGIPKFAYPSSGTTVEFEMPL